MHNIFFANPLLSLGIIVSLFGIIAAHRLILYRNKLKLIEEKRLQFRDAITQEISDIRTRKFIAKDFSHIGPIQKAMLNYRPFLNNERQIAIDAAWAEYQDHEEYRAWTVQRESPMPQSDPWPMTEANNFLNNLLKFTEINERRP